MRQTYLKSYAIHIIDNKSLMFFPKRLELSGSLLLCHILIHIAKNFMPEAPMRIHISPNQISNHRSGTILWSYGRKTLYHSHHWGGYSEWHYGHYVNLVAVLFLQELPINVDHSL